MGRWKRKNRANKNQEGSRKDNPNNPPRSQFGGPHNKGNNNYTPAWQTNRRMEAYYAYQGLHHKSWDEETKTFVESATTEDKNKEAKLWMDTCKKILPASFRIGVDVDPVIRERLEKELHEMVGSEMELTLDETGKTMKIAPAKRIPFVPHAYQLAVDRHTIRKNDSLKVLFEWLKVQTEAGFVTRQETVSMIPPVVMNVQPHHQVLDMCAAPGSKTSQILEVVSAIPEGAKEPVGCVVANDADPKRAYMLVHQLKRIHSPVAIVTSCDAQFFPLLNSKDDKDQGKEGMFDSVLADVPCSGDGTMRKNPQVWKKWSALNSYGLHPLQLSIALNGARLTKVGGYLCYSTCAMSPIENEAVVAELLRSTDGSLELVDRRSELTDIKGRPGWSSWKVLREEKSQRRSKNEQKKHNKKMRERRAKFKEAGKAIWKEGDKKEDETKTEGAAAASDETAPKADVDMKEETKTNGEESAEKTTEEAAAAPAKKKRDDEDEDGNFKKEAPHNTPLGPPASWDEETLKARCTAEGMTEYASFDDVEEIWSKTLRKSVFPPTAEEAASMNLDRCMRFLPHDMDTSGFFVALFKKVQPLSARARSHAAALATSLRHDIVDANGQETPKTPAKKKTKLNPEEGEEKTNVEATEEAEATEGPQAKIVKGKINYSKGNSAPKGNMGNENFVLVNEPNLTPLATYFGMPADDYPKDQFMSRASGDAKVMYFIGKAVKKYFDAGLQQRVTIINSGLKAFERNSHECGVKYRVTQEGIHYLAPYISNRKFVIDLKDFLVCLGSGAVPLVKLSAEFAETVRGLSVGSFVVALKGYEDDIQKKLMMVMWRCRGDNMNCLVAKVEKDGMKSKLRAITGEEFPDEEEEEEKKEPEAAKEEEVTSTSYPKDAPMEEVVKDEEAKASS